MLKLKESLDKVLTEYPPVERVSADPVQFQRRFFDEGKSQTEVEAVAVFSAMLSYGSAAQFTKNMELSLKRANAVAEYMFQTQYDRSYSEPLRKMLIVEGRSFNEPILTEDGKEDFARSRRVELKLTVKRWDIKGAFGFL